MKQVKNILVCMKIYVRYMQSPKGRYEWKYNLLMILLLAGIYLLIWEVLRYVH